MAAEGAVRLVVIGGRAPRIEGVVIEEVPWREATEVSLINTFDVGVMPLPDDEWARGKCAFKLIQYMACGVPVVASRVGANVDVVTSECGFLVSNDDEWLAALRTLREDSALRARMGSASRTRIEMHYSLRHNLPILVETIRDVAKT
jgi:glycosyltransferase involved in cell wall biosynthesis